MDLFDLRMMSQDVNPTVAAAKKRAQQPAHQRNNDRAKDRAPKSMHLKTRHNFTDELQRQGVDDQDEKTERDQDEWKAKEQ